MEEAPVTPENSWVEGPSALNTDDGIILYFDAYTKGHYRAMKSADLKSWTDVTDRLVMPKGIRHGTAFEVSSAVLEVLRKP